MVTFQYTKGASKQDGNELFNRSVAIGQAAVVLN